MNLFSSSFVFECLTCKFFLTQFLWAWFWTLHLHHLNPQTLSFRYWFPRRLTSSFLGLNVPLLAQDFCCYWCTAPSMHIQIIIIIHLLILLQSTVRCLTDNTVGMVSQVYNFTYHAHGINLQFCSFDIMDSCSKVMFSLLITDDSSVGWGPGFVEGLSLKRRRFTILQLSLFIMLMT